MESGEYLMGDSSEGYGVEKLQCGERKGSKPLYRVELNSYSLSKSKVDNQQYQLYLAWNGLRGREVKGHLDGRDWNDRKRILGTPARVDWHEAERYCAWLGGMTGLPFSLPTEAQWEYMMCGRGEYVVAPTDSGTIRIEGWKGIDVTTATGQRVYTHQDGNSLDIVSPFPRDSRPPSPLRIYDIVGNGWERMEDWYDPEHCSRSPVKDLQDPEQPVLKDADRYYTRALRSQDCSGPGRRLMMVRYKTDPGNKDYPPTDKTVCCVINHPSPME